MISFSYNGIMARFYDSTYDPRQDSGTSGSEVSDLNPEQGYDVDLRRIDIDKRGDVEDINDEQGRVKKFFKAAKAAGSFRQRSGFDEPSLGGRIPVGKADLGGTELPSLRDVTLEDQVQELQSMQLNLNHSSVKLSIYN